MNHPPEHEWTPIGEDLGMMIAIKTLAQWATSHAPDQEATLALLRRAARESVAGINDGTGDTRPYLDAIRRTAAQRVDDIFGPAPPVPPVN